MKNKFLSLSNSVVKHELISGSLYMFLGFISASFFSFILNLFFARSLPAVDYGIYASLLSILMLAGVLSQSLIPVIVRFAADYFSTNQYAKANALYIKSFKLTFVISLSIFAIFISLIIPISKFLHLNNLQYVILIGFIIFIQYLGIVNTAFLQSLLKFKALSLITAIGGFIRLLTGVILVMIGFRVFGALWAVFIAFFTPFILSFFPLKFLYSKKKEESISLSNKEIIYYAIPTSIAILSLVSLASTDVILVRHFFSAKEAGLYGGLSLIGKVIFYFTGPIPSVMFPLLIKRHAKKQSFNNLFYIAILLVLLPSSVITTIYFVFPKESINFFLGNQYSSIGIYLGLFGTYITIFSVLNLFINFFLSLNKTKIFIPPLIAAILQIIFIYFFHSNIFQVIGFSLVISFGLLVYLLGYYIFLFVDFKKIAESIVFLNNPKN